MSDISAFAGQCTPEAQAAWHKWARSTHLIHSRIEEPRTYLPASQVLAEALLLRDELGGRIRGLNKKIRELRESQ